MRTIKWGIIGTGYIASMFAEDMKYVQDSHIVAVTSRRLEKASKFAHTHDIHNVYDQFEVMLAQADIDAIYIATPHPQHKENTLMALKAKKAVLCEKPIGLNLNEAEEMMTCAKNQGVLLMEGMWTRFKPISLKVKELIESGIIGKVKMIKADFCFDKGETYPESGRLLDPALGGGARLDVGIYPVAFARSIFGQNPDRIVASSTTASTGVDLTSLYNFFYDDNRFASLFASVDVETDQSAYIGGTKGHIIIPKFWSPIECLVNAEGVQEHYKIADQGRGYEHEIMAFNDAIRKDQLEVPLMPHKETLDIMKSLDQINEILLK